MLLSPEDVIRKTFATVVLRRGYDADEVDAFLEEVVQELQRLNGRLDELQAQVTTLEAEGPSAEDGQRLRREQEQVDLVRAERRELVADMAQLQERYDVLRSKVEALEEQAAS